MPQIRPIAELRNTSKISEICHNQSEPVFITKNGYGDLDGIYLYISEHMVAPKAANDLMDIIEASIMKLKEC
jgi:hypothetical protein